LALPGAYVPAGIALQVFGAHKPFLHNEAVVLKEGLYLLLHIILVYYIMEGEVGVCCPTSDVCKTACAYYYKQEIK
jgi:hypothetical protein